MLGALPSLSAVVIAVVAVYAAGVHGPFLFDDIPNIVGHPLVAIDDLSPRALRDAALSNESGPTGRPLAALSFALNYWFAGQRFDPFAFKLVNLVIHALNACLLLLLLRHLLPRLHAPSPARQPPVSVWLLLSATLLWALHPIQLTGVLYAVQRMATLASTCVLAGLLLHLHGRTQLATGARSGIVWMLAGWLIGAPLGALFKESALLYPLFAGVIELTAYRQPYRHRMELRWIRAYFTVFVALPGIAIVAAVGLRPSTITAGYVGRNFDLGDRLLTQCRVLIDYVGMLLLPRPTAFGLFHDDIVVSRGLLDPPLTLTAVAALLLLFTVSAWAWSRGARVLPFAVGWFAAGHVLESTLLPLEMMFEHRNYLASVGPLVAVVLATARLSRKLSTPLLVAVVVVPALVTVDRAIAWGDAGRLVARTYEHHPRSPRANLMVARFEQSRGDLATAFEHLRQATRLDSSDATGLVSMLRIVATVQGALDGGALQVPEGTPPSVPTDYDSPLEPWPDYLHALRSELALELTRRLMSGPVSSAEVAALREIRTCVEAGDAACHALAAQTAELLARLAGRTDVIGARLLAIISAERGRLLARTGQVDEAVRWLERAWAIDEGDLQVLVLKAAVEIAQERWSEAERSIELLASRHQRIGFSSRQVLELRALLTSARDAEAQREGVQPVDGGG